MNHQQSLGDFAKYKSKSEKINKKFLENDHCSAFIKVTENNDDLLVAHTSFSGFHTMTRIWKLYDFHYHVNSKSEKPVPSHAISFASYPATIMSMDDFYQTSQGLVITETTNAILNPKLFELYLKPETVIETYRVMVASRLALNAEMWVKIFAANNDGTYCNQWMVLDYKKFTPGKPVPDKVFYVAEQIPGDVIYADQSYMLRQRSYWKSYNTPFYPEVAARSGWNDYKAKYGNYYDHEKTSRSLLFDSVAHTVKDLDTLELIMRKDDLYTNNLSSCSAIGLKCDPDYSGRLMISSRQDLSPANGTYPISVIAHANHGALDLKATNVEMFRRFSMRAISGPPHNNTPTFDWSTIKDLNVPHYGLPDRWEFPTVNITYVHHRPTPPESLKIEDYEEFTCMNLN